MAARTRFAPWPVALCGMVLIGAGLASFVLTRALAALNGPDSVLATALGRDVKGNVSVAIYAASIPLAFVTSWLAGSLYVLVAVIWLVPDRRVEKTLGQPVSR